MPCNATEGKATNSTVRNDPNVVLPLPLPAGRAASAAWLALGLLLFSGCANMSLLPSVDAELCADLRLHLRAGTGATSPELTRFELFLSSVGEPVNLAWRSIRVTANGQLLESPREWSLAMRLGVITRFRHSAYDYRALWYMRPEHLVSWLGGPGRYAIQVAIGPVHSNEVVIECTSQNEVIIVEAGAAPELPA